MRRCTHLNSAATSGRTFVLLLFILFVASGCTTTGEVVESWRGQPIEAVVAQWGPPGSYESVSNGLGSISAFDFHGRTRSSEQPIGPGAHTYEWTYITHTFHPERCEVTEYKDGCKTVTTTRFIPARWSRSSDDFYLMTDDAGRVVDGGSSYERKLWPFNRLGENRRGWGSLRQGWDEASSQRLAAE